jgi:hypothetical protein
MGKVAPTEDQLKKELFDLNQRLYPDRQEGEFTTAEYADANGLTYCSATARLKGLVQAGKIKKGKFFDPETEKWTNSFSVA